MTVEEIQKAGIDINKILDAIWRGMKEQFGGAAEVGMKTWEGLRVTTKSYFDELKRQIGKGGLFDYFKSALGLVNKTIEDNFGSISEFGKKVAEALINTMKNVVLGIAGVIDAIKPAISSLWNIIKDIWESFKNLPDWVKEVGLIGAILGGKKGAIVVGGLIHLFQAGKNTVEGFIQAWKGNIKWSEFAKMDYTELKNKLQELKDKGIIPVKEELEDLPNISVDENSLVVKFQKIFDAIEKNIPNVQPRLKLKGIKAGKALGEGIARGAKEALNTNTILDREVYMKEIEEQKKVLLSESKELTEGISKYTKNYTLLGDVDVVAKLTENLGKKTEKVIKETADKTEDLFSGMLYTAQDTAYQLVGAFEDTFLGRFKEGLDGLLDYFKRFLARMVAVALARPIVVPVQAVVAGVGQGMLGGRAGAASAGGFNLGGIGTGITNFLNTPVLGLGSLGGILGSGLMGFGIGSLFGGGTTGQIGGAIGGIIGHSAFTSGLLGGLWSGIASAATSIGGGAFGAMIGNIVPVIGTIAGGLLGSLIGGLFGKKIDKTPRMQIAYSPSGTLLPRDFKYGGRAYYGEGWWFGEGGEGHIPGTPVVNIFKQVRATLVDFLEAMGGDLSRAEAEWRSAARRFKNKEGFEKIIKEWISEYAEFLTGINFQRFQRQGEDIVDTIDRVINAFMAFPKVLDSISDYINAVRGNYDQIAKWKDSLQDATEQIDRLKKALTKVTDPTDAVNLANQLKQAIYDRYMLERQMVEGLVNQIKQLQMGQKDFLISMARRLDRLRGTATAIDEIEKAISYATEQFAMAGTDEERLQWLQKAVQYVDEWYQEATQAVEKQLQLTQQWKNLLGDIEKTILNLKTGTASPRDVFERLYYLQEEVQRVQGLYSASEGMQRIQYARTLQDLIQQYLGLAGQAFQRPSTEYENIYTDMLNLLGTIRADAEQQATGSETLLQQIKDQAAQYYEWAMTTGAELYQSAISDMTTQLTSIIGDRTVEEYIADLQMQTVSELSSIKTILINIAGKFGVPGFAEGGYVTAPTLAWVGEKEPEFIIPKSKMQAIKKEIQTITIAPQITINATGDASPMEIAKEVERILIQSIKYGKGKIAVKEALQYG